MVDQLEKLAAAKMDDELKKKVNGIIIGAGRELEKQIKDIRVKDPPRRQSSPARLLNCSTSLQKRPPRSSSAISTRFQNRI